MKFIKVLPEGLIDRIAAGEVIENPASVVKELVENSLDAQARNIEVAISKGGKEEIMVVDDGEGIPKDQVEIAFCRHATSKIKSWPDLLRTMSMGFRGEALPSISSVSIMELTTYFEGERTGTTIRFEGGKQIHFGPAPPRKGCAVSVRNIFYNVPARRKFLKSDTSEKRKIAEVLRRYLIARPDVGFKIHYDSKLAGSYPGSGDLMARLETIWGNPVVQKLIPLDQSPPGPVRVEGCVSTPEISRNNRSELFFFVNQRPVLERVIFGAVSAAYGRALPPGRFPYAAIFLNIDPGFVDINVHPAKTEVRFADEGYIFSILKKAMDKALSLPVGLDLKGPSPRVFGRGVSFEEARKALSVTGRRESVAPGEHALQTPAEDRAVDLPSAIDTGEETATDAIVQLFDTFILARKGSDLLVLDQHTAHERVMYERTLLSLTRQPAPSQKLLFEERVKLSPEEFRLVEETESLLLKAGFEVRIFGISEVIVSGVPAEMSGMAAGQALRDVLATLLSNLGEGQALNPALAAAVACKSAIKAGQRLSQPQMKALLVQLLECREPYRCPHGRPTMANLSRHDLERFFKRR